MDQHKYCRRADLGNEASVEAFFVNRLLEDLGYRDSEVKTKESVETLTLHHGRRPENVRPDYVLVCRAKPRWVLDAKGTKEDVDDYVGQGSDYSAALNRRYTGENPVRYYALTNGLSFKLYNWDEEEPFLILHFSDFFDDNPRFAVLRSYLDAKVMRRVAPPSKPKAQATISLRRDPQGAKRAFKQCHQLIWKAEDMNPQAAFPEFIKIVFVKMWQDRLLREDKDLRRSLDRGEPIPKSRVHFSTHWIDLMVPTHQNPVEALLFRPLADRIEEAVQRREKKRIFDPGESLRISPGTIREVVARLEEFDLFGIDDDLNGRLFEEFLSATMRGQALGQYFTPRSIVKFMERLAAPVATRDRIEKVIDACCGTGGFLIEVLTDMRNQVRENRSLSSTEEEKMLKDIANESIYGIDSGVDPPVARIARINMYLHGDGGSRIYAADSLDKEMRIDPTTDLDLKLEREELRGFLDGGLRFDLALTNPPFAKSYSDKQPEEARLLVQYSLTTLGLEEAAKSRPSLMSRVMFLERYADLLRPGGRLLTVIDDTTLATPKHKFVRDFIRKYFIIRAVISLPGDAFQSAGARAKTSILYLVRRSEDADEGQPDVFMEEALYLGLDNVPPTAPKSRADEALRKAKEEADDLMAKFQAFLRGKKGPWLVPAARIANRLDVKFCLPRPSPVDEKWRKQGIEVVPLEKLVEPAWEPFSPKEFPDKVFVTLYISYNGIPRRKPWRGRLGKEISYNELMAAQAGQIVVSNINAVHGSIAIIPEHFEETYVTQEYTVLRVTDRKTDPTYLWAYMRSPEARARMLSDATGIGRTRVSWEVLRTLPVPLLNRKKQADIAQHYEEYLSSLWRAAEEEHVATSDLNSALDLDNEWAVKRLRAAKPPR